MSDILKIFEENENGRSERMNYGYREQKLTELGVNDKSFEQAQAAYPGNIHLHSRNGGIPKHIKCQNQ